METENIIGNREVREYLSNMIKQGNILHSYMFVGTEGIGKFKIAKKFAKDILCIDNKMDDCECRSCLCFNNGNHTDYKVIDVLDKEKTISIDQIREFNEDISEKPITSDRKVYIINNAEKMTVPAQNCLLKTLEEPPSYGVIILIVNDENNIIPTIQSRCMKIKFKNIPDDELLKYAKDVLGYGEISNNLLKSFDGSILKAIKLKDNAEKFAELERIVDEIGRSDLIDFYKSTKCVYDKENVIDYLNYIIVCLYSKKDQNEKNLDLVGYVNEAIDKLRYNTNMDMTLDSLFFKIWEEMNESSNRC